MRVERQSTMRMKAKLLMLVAATLAALCLIHLIPHHPAMQSYSHARTLIVAHPSPTTTTTTIAPRKRKADAVIVLTQCRSGSSFVGEMFNRQRNVSYFYEPLYPFREANCLPNPARLANVTVLALQGLVNCRFDGFPELYRNAFAATKQSDDAGCGAYNLCFVECAKCHAFLKRDSRVCKKSCPRPLDLTLLGEHCRGSEFRAAKINYLSDLRLIAPMLDHDRYDVTVKVVHLVRDPRATILSKFRSENFKGKMTKEYARRGLADVCARLRRNTLFASENLNGTNAYMRVRHEDVSLQSLQHVRAIYDFAGRQPSDELMSWVRGATTAKRKANTFGTARDSAAVVSAWRNDSRLDFEVVKEIQRGCEDALRLLGYRPFRSAREMADLSIPSFV